MNMALSDFEIYSLGIFLHVFSSKPVPPEPLEINNSIGTCGTPYAFTMLAFSFIFSLFLCQHSIYTSKVDKSLIQLSILNHRFLSQSLETIRSDAAQNRQLLNEAQKSFKHEMTYLDDSSTEFQVFIVLS